MNRREVFPLACLICVLFVIIYSKTEGLIANNCDNLLLLGDSRIIIISLCLTGGRIIMAISYNKLWKLLIDRKMSKVTLRQKAKIAPNTMTRLNRDEQVSLTVLNKICSALSVNIGDIMDFIPEEQSSEDQ